MKASILFAVGSIAAKFAGERDLSDYSFEQYLIEFGKTYSSDVLATREAAFKVHVSYFFLLL